MILDHLPGRNLHYQGNEWLYFSGTAYLGLAKHPAFHAYLSEGMSLYGANFGGSRLSNMQLAIFEEAEEALAKWLGLPAVLTLSSGSLAGQLLVRFLVQDGDCYFAPSLHPALSGQGDRFAGSFTAWIEYIKSLPPESNRNQFILSSSVDVLNAKAYPFSWIKDLDATSRFHLVLDDSHGLGLFGEKGQGSISKIPETSACSFILMSSMGKALGIPGGLIGGSKELKHALRKSPFFGGASPVIPAYLYAYLKSQDLIQEQLQKLRKHIQCFSLFNKDSNLFQQIPMHPVFHIKDNQLVDYLSQHHIMVSSFPYPSPDSPKISRIVLNAAHTEEDLEKLCTLIGDYRNHKH